MRMTKVKLGDILDVRRGASLSGDYYATKGKYIRLTLGNFNYPGGGFKANISKDNIYFTGFVKPEFILHKGDIITPLTEQVAGLLGETAHVPEDDKYIQSGDIGLVIPDEKLLDKNYAYYLLSSPLIKRQLGAAAQQTKIRHTSPEKIKACEAWIPELNTQHQIGMLLDTINKKIEANNALSSKLESLARMIYDYWFLQFDFPDENGRPYRSSGGKMVWNAELKREIPERWEVKKLSNILNTKLGGTPSTEHEEYWNGRIHWLNSSETSVSPVLDSELCITEEGMHNSSTAFAKAGSVVMSIVRYIRPAILGIDTCFNQSVISIDQSERYKSSFIYPMICSHVSEYMALRSGAQQPHINKGIVDNTLLVCPIKNVLEKYYGQVDGLYKMQLILAKETRHLASLRDFLLPLLMNGQVTFKEAKAKVDQFSDYWNAEDRDMVAEHGPEYGRKGE